MTEMILICSSCGEPLEIVKDDSADGVISLEIEPCSNCMEQEVQDKMTKVKQMLSSVLCDIEHNLDV